MTRRKKDREPNYLLRTLVWAAVGAAAIWAAALVIELGVDALARAAGSWPV